MSRLLRHYSPGRVYFITSVTHKRKPILVDMFSEFWQSIQISRVREPFELLAWVVMPDHVHMIIDPGAANLSNLVRRWKLSFAYQYRSRSGLHSDKVWQARFWDHIIRDQNDMNKHVDYIHYNPVKHGLVSIPGQWQHSSFSAFLSEGLYPADWGVSERISLEGEFGE